MAPQRPGVGVGVIVERDGRVLLVRRKHRGAGSWAAPGGYLDFGETLEECAVRETREETGVEITDPSFIAITNDVVDAERHNITVWMAGRRIAGEGTVTAPDEIEDVGWFAWDALPEPLFVAIAHFVRGERYPRPTAAGVNQG